MASMREVTIRLPHNKAAAQCAADVSNAKIMGSDGNRANLGHFGDVVAQQVLDAHFQRHGGRRATGAGPLHMQVDDGPKTPKPHLFSNLNALFALFYGILSFFPTSFFLYTRCLYGSLEFLFRFYARLIFRPSLWHSLLFS